MPKILLYLPAFPSVPVQCSGPLAGVVPLAHRRRPVVGAAPDGSPAPAAPDGPGWAAVPAHCVPLPARSAAPAAQRSAPVALPPRPHATPPAPVDIETKSREITIILWYFSDPCGEEYFTFQPLHREVRWLIQKKLLLLVLLCCCPNSYRKKHCVKTACVSFDLKQIKLFTLIVIKTKVENKYRLQNQSIMYMYIQLLMWHFYFVANIFSWWTEFSPNPIGGVWTCGHNCMYVIYLWNIVIYMNWGADLFYKFKNYKHMDQREIFVQAAGGGDRRDVGRWTSPPHLLQGHI